MKKTVLLRSFAFLFGMLMCTFMVAQSTVSGTITDATGEALIGANVLVKGTTDGTISDFDGTFEVNTSASFPLTLVFSFTGYNTTEVDVANASTTVNVTLQEGVLLGDDVVISASRRREKIQEAPASVSVLTARKLEATPNDNPARAIINEPGVYMQQQGAGRVNVQLRGDGGLFGSATFPILDYRSLSGPGLGTFDVLNSPLNNIDIERIEVVRGPGSALYGPGVTAGVVHFISKSPIDKPGTTIELMGGELSTFGVSARHATKVSDKFGFKINAVYKKGGEFLLDPNDPVDANSIGLLLPTLTDPATGQPLPRGVYAPAINGGIVDATATPRLLVGIDDLDGDQPSTNPLQDFWKSTVLNGTLEFRPQDDLSFVLSGGMNYGSSIFYNSQGFGRTAATENWAQVRMQKGGLFAQAFWLANNGGTEDVPTFLYQTSQETVVDRTQFEAQLQYNFDTPGLLDANWTAGFDYRLSVADTRNQVYGREEDDDDFGIIGGYLQGKFALGNKLDLVLAGRYDQFNFLDEGAFSPRAVFVFKPDPKHTFRAGFNRAVSAPSQLQVNIDFPVNSPVPGAFDIWLLGNKNAQTFGANPQIVFNGLLPFPSLPVGTPGLPLAYVQGAVSAAVIPAIAQGLVAANPLFAQLVPSITDYLSNPANFAQGFGGQFFGYNLFSGQPLGLLDAPAATLRTEDTWEVGYKGLFADKLGVSVDVYNRKIDGATLFTAISPTYTLLGTDGIPGQLASAVGSNFATFLTQLLSPFVGGPIPDQATLEATVAQVAGIVGGAYGQGAGGFLQAIAPLLPILATTPTQEVPNNGVTHNAAGYRTFAAYDYWGADIGLNYFVSNDLSIFANYSWTSDNIFNPQIVGVDGTEQTSISQPNNRYRVGFNLTPEYGWRANVAFQHDPSFPVFLGQFTGDTDERNLIDAGVGYKFSNGLSLNVAAQNLFDSEYRAYPAFPKIGRRVIGTLQYTFGDGSDGSSSSMASSNKKMDSDGDGIKDHKDACPDIAGIRKYKGCPMSAEDMAAKAAAEAKAAADAAEAARIKAEEEARAKAEAAARARAEAEAKRKAEEEARMKAEEAAKKEAEAAAAAAEAARVEALRKRNAELTTRFTAALKGLQFNSARSTFKQSSYAKMDEAVAILNQYPDLKILIQGHTDSQGKAESNLKLSQARADAVKEYLVSKGIAASRLSTSGLGEDYPIADNNTAEGRKMNRRVEFIILR